METGNEKLLHKEMSLKLKLKIGRAFPGHEIYSAGLSRQKEQYI